MTKLPPIEKIYEAWSALADGRVTIKSLTLAYVTSSDHAKTYTIAHDIATNTYSSDDNSTFWRGYPGYPVIAVMMARGVLPYNPEYGAKWAGINWHELNLKHKRDYAAAVAQAEEERGIDPDTAKEIAQEVMDALAALPAKTKRYYPKRL